MYEGYSPLKDTDDEQSNFAAKIQNLDKGKKQLKKSFFKNNLGLFFDAREKVFNNLFNSRLFPIKILDKIPTRVPKQQQNQLNTTNLN